jgi:hypothetical protein
LPLGDHILQDWPLVLLLAYDYSDCQCAGFAQQEEQDETHSHLLLEEEGQLAYLHPGAQIHNEYDDEEAFFLGFIWLRCGVNF